MKRHVVDRIMRRAANGAAIIYVELAAKAVELAIEHGIDIKEVPALVRGLSKPLEQDTAAAKAARSLDRPRIVFQVGICRVEGCGLPLISDDPDAVMALCKYHRRVADLPSETEEQA